MSIAIAIGGLALLVLIHELGHFVVARAVGMRPRKFYVFFPPALVKTVRGGIEYGIGTIPLGGYVKIPGMHRPAAGDVDAQLGRALDESPWIGRHSADVKEALTREDHDAARAALPELAAAVERADLSEAARRSAEKGLTDLDDGALEGRVLACPGLEADRGHLRRPLRESRVRGRAARRRVRARRPRRRHPHRGGGHA